VYIPPVPVVAVPGPSPVVPTVEPASAPTSPGVVKGGDGLPGVGYPGVGVNPPFELG